jgi:multidrug efflux pump subunit AcrB
MASSEADVNRQNDDSHVTARQWKWTILAGMASYLDAGSIVALAAGLALWQQYLPMSSTTVGLLAALGPNGFFVPVLASLSIRPVALILMIFLLISGVVGFFFMPNTAGKSLEEIEAERSGAPVREHVTA